MSNNPEETAAIMRENNFFYQDRNKKHRNPYHYENDLVIVIDLEVSEADPSRGSMTALKFLPIDGITFEMSSVFPPLHIESILPSKVDTFNPSNRTCNKLRVQKLLNYGVPIEIANHLFIDWFNSLKLFSGSKLTPVCFNWAECKPYLVELCGDYETFETIFNTNRVIDLNIIQWFIQDLAWNNSEKYPFNYMATNPEVSIVKKLEVVKMNPINTYARCIDLANCYKKLRTISLPKGVDIH
jgi:hypothetical protein